MHMEFRYFKSTLSSYREELVLFTAITENTVSHLKILEN